MKSSIEKLKSALMMQRKIIGIKFIYDADAFDACDSPLVKHKLSYCKMISLVSKGKAFKVDLDHSGCNGAINALGFTEGSNDVKTGQSYYRLGMYKTIGIAQKTLNGIASMKGTIYGLVAKPLEEFEEEADVVLLIVDSYNAMRLLQGYSYHYGPPRNMMFSGNQGVCLECTTTPFVNHDMNLSMLCSNTRFTAQWDDHEMGVGMPFDLFDKVVEGVVQTINSSETDDRKQGIYERSRVIGSDIEINFGENYYWKKA